MHNKSTNLPSNPMSVDVFLYSLDQADGLVGIDWQDQCGLTLCTDSDEHPPAYHGELSANLVSSKDAHDNPRYDVVIAGDDEVPLITLVGTEDRRAVEKRADLIQRHIDWARRHDGLEAESVEAEILVAARQTTPEFFGDVPIYSMGVAGVRVWVVAGMNWLFDQQSAAVEAASGLKHWFELRVDDEVVTTFDVQTVQDAEYEAEIFIPDHDWGVSSSHCIKAEVVEATVGMGQGEDYANHTIVRVLVHPKEPRCTQDEAGHLWESPHEVVGGDLDNPGVYGSRRGPGIEEREVCGFCGLYKVTDRSAQHPLTGEDYAGHLEYREADEKSMNWLAANGVTTGAPPPVTETKPRLIL